jgi:hypothetical protein
MELENSLPTSAGCLSSTRFRINRVKHPPEEGLRTDATIIWIFGIREARNNMGTIKQQYAKPLFYALIVKLKKWA